MVDNSIDCEETIYQCDWVIENAYDFIGDLFNIVKSELPTKDDTISENSSSLSSDIEQPIDIFLYGTVSWFNSEKGFGYILAEDNVKYFIHFSNIKKDGYKNLDAEDNVRFKTKDSLNEAIEVEVI